MVNTYLDQIGREKPLTDAEEAQLSAQALAGSEQALSKLVSANLRYVVTLASQYRGRGIALDDLISEGNIGLITAARKYDATRGTRLAVFAAPYIRRQIEQAITRQTTIYKIPADVASPSAERQKARALSVDAPLGGRKDMNLLSVIANGETGADDSTDVVAAAQALEAALKQMGEREQRVLRACYGIGCERRTMAETADDMGIKRERVRQIRNSALRKLRKLVPFTI